MNGVVLKWEPSPPFRWTRDTLPLRIKLSTLIKAMIDEQHRAGGIPRWKPSLRVKAISKRYYAGQSKGMGITGWRTGRLARGWHPHVVAYGAYCENKTAYAVDFYDGHPRRRVWVPPYMRRLRRSGAKYLGKGKGKKTVGITMVKGHFTTEPAQVARPIRFPAHWIYRFEALMASYFATGRITERIRLI